MRLFNINNSIEYLCYIELLHFNFPNFAKSKTVIKQAAFTSSKQ